jgi:hypothetical protein
MSMQEVITIHLVIRKRQCRAHSNDVKGIQLLYVLNSQDVKKNNIVSYLLDWTLENNGKTRAKPRARGLSPVFFTLLQVSENPIRI